MMAFIQWLVPTLLGALAGCGVITVIKKLFTGRWF